MFLRKMDKADTPSFLAGAGKIWRLWKLDGSDIRSISLDCLAGLSSAAKKKKKGVSARLLLLQ